MTDNSQWQEGQPPPPPSNNPETNNPEVTPGHPYAGGPAQPANSPQGSPPNPPQQGPPPNVPPQGGAWQDQHGQPQGGWQGQPAYQHNQQASGDERTWMILAHVSAPIAFIVSAGWLSIAGPLLVWLFKKDSSPAVRQAAAGAFNFNLTFWLLYLLGWVVAIFTLGLGFLVAIPFWILIFLVAAYVHIKGAIRASRGETYTYPFQLPVLS